MDNSAYAVHTVSGSTKEPVQWQSKQSSKESYHSQRSWVLNDLVLIGECLPGNLISGTRHNICPDVAWHCQRDFWYQQ